MNQLSVAAGFDGPELHVTFTLSPTSYIEYAPSITGAPLGKTEKKKRFIHTKNYS